MAQRSLGLPAGPLSAYLGVRNANQESDEEAVGMLARIQAAQDALKQREKLLNETIRHHGAVENAARQPRPRDFIPLGAAGGLVPDDTQTSSSPQQPRGYTRVLGTEPRPTSTTTNEPLVKIVGPDGKPVLVRRSQAEGKTPYSPSIAGGGELSPRTLTFTAKQYLAGDRQAAQGYARNATARIALQNEIVEEATRQGKRPEEVAALMAEYAGLTAGSRTVGQRAANISLAATEALEMIPIVKTTSDDFKRTTFVPWNTALAAYESGTGSPEVTNFGASLNALVNVYARAINPTGVPTVSDKEHARAVINRVQSPAQVDGVLNIIRQELEIAKKAPGAVRQQIRTSIVGGSPSGGPKEGDKQTSRSGKPMIYRGGQWEYE